MKKMYFNFWTASSVLTLLFLLTPVFTYAESDTGTVTDFDGNVYKTVKIGEQWWMAENLRATHYYNGTAITYSATAKTASSDDYVGYYKYPNNNASQVPTQGLLYSWGALFNQLGTVQKAILPEGWCIPDTTDWGTLARTLGGADVAGGKLKGRDTLWLAPNTGATDAYAFNALPVGDCNTTGYTVYREEARFWTPQLVMVGGSGRVYMSLSNKSAALAKGQYRNCNTLSVRLIKKTTTDLKLSSEKTNQLEVAYNGSTKQISIAGLSAGSKITLYALNGQVVKQCTLSDKTLSVEELASGVYIVSALSDASKHMAKFLKY